MAATRAFTLAEAIPERSTFKYRAEMTDQDEVALDPDQVTSILATLRDVTSNTILNSRNAQEVLDENGGTLTEGLFELQFEEDDTAIIGIGNVEQRKLTLDFRLAGGGRVTREVTFYVRNFGDVSA